MKTRLKNAKLVPSTDPGILSILEQGLAAAERELESLQRVHSEGEEDEGPRAA